MDKELLMKSPSMADVFSVYMNSDREINLYGTITVTDGLSGCQHIYSRSSEDSKCKPQGSTPLLLTGPARFVSGFDSFRVDVDLKDLNGDDEFKGWFYFDNHIMRHYLSRDIPLSKTFNGKHGSFVTVHYVVFKHAVQAIVEVKLIKYGVGDGSSANVRGQIIAQNSLIAPCADENASVLMGWGWPVDTSPGDIIPLSRSLVIVPSNAILMVNVDLRDTYNNEIACGVAEFCPKCSGNSAMKIAGEYGEIRVTVTWVFFLDTPLVE